MSEVTLKCCAMKVIAPLGNEEDRVLFMTVIIPVKNMYSFFHFGQLYGLSASLGRNDIILETVLVLGEVVGCELGSSTDVASVSWEPSDGSNSTSLSMTGLDLFFLLS